MFQAKSPYQSEYIHELGKDVRVCGILWLGIILCID